MIIFHLLLCLARVISLSGHLPGSIFSQEVDIASTQNFFISFQPIICKLNYSHVININIVFLSFTSVFYVILLC